MEPKAASATAEEPRPFTNGGSYSGNLPGGHSRVQAWVSTHPGLKRDSNQDNYLSRCDAGLWMVADGAGGHSGGEAASRAVADALSTIPASLCREDIVAAAQQALQRTHHQLRTGRSATSGAASTVVLLIACGDRVTCLWAGDSRAYRWRDGELVMLTRDHSVVQEMVAAGRITSREARQHSARHVITRAVGADCAVLKLDQITEHSLPGDVYLLCSDGVSGLLEEDEIVRCFVGGAERAADELMLAALSRGAPDNVTAVVVRLSEH